MYKLELKSSHEIIETVNVADVESIFYCKPTDPDILTVLMTNGKRLYCDEVCPVQEEPVSEDLEKAAEQDVCEVINTCSGAGIPNDHIPSWVQDAMITEFIHGAKWQTEQFEKKRLKFCNTLTKEQAKIEQDFVVNFIKENNCTPTFIDAIEYGMKLKLKDKKKL